MRHFFALVFLLVSAGLSGQNLVVNPSFEKEIRQVSDCSFAGSDLLLTNSCKGWNGFFQQTPDYHFYSPNTLNCSVPKPRTGTHALGLICFFPRQADFFHEHAQGSLSKPMEKGKIYHLEFWLTQADSAGKFHIRRQVGKDDRIQPVACNRLGVFFTVEPNSTRSDFQQDIEQFDLRPQVVFEEIMTTKAGEWRKITATFKADKPYKFFTVGNFSADVVTETLPKVSGEPLIHVEVGEGEKTVRPIGYYLFDDFFIAENPPPPDLSESLKTEGRFVFQNVLFDFGKADLLPSSFLELDRLVDFLTKNPSISIEIGGHTDSVGDDAANQQLSENRARAVVGYLVSKKMEAKRLSAKGFGESQPVAENESEAGRALNRRVECRVQK